MNANADTWPRKQLGDITNLKMGSTPSTAHDEYWLNGDVLWATPSDLGRGEIIRLRDTARKITTAGLNAKRMEPFPCGSILLSTTATIGNVAIADRPTYCNQQITAIQPHETVLSEYIAYYLIRSKADLMRLGGTSTATHINQKNLSTLSIPVPPIHEQRRIVDILSRAEGIVRLRREAQKKAAEIIPALFIDMFGDPATNPKGWPIVSVGDVISSADYGSSTKASDYGAGIPFIRMVNVDYGGYTDLANLKYVELSPEDTNKYSLLEGDILFNRTNSKELVGKTGFWDGSCEAVVASYFIRLRVKRDTLNPLYLWAFMNTRHMKRVLLDTARGAIGQSNINAKELKSFTIGLPKLDLQNDFEKSCLDLFGIKSQQSAATQKAEATFAALLSRAFQREL
jgi:type I restriction enzyme S subunit